MELFAKMKVMRNHDDAATELKEICTAAADLNARLEDRNRNVPMPFLRESFRVSCCCLTPVILSEGPDVMKTLLDGLGNLRKLDFQPMTDMVSSVADTLGNLDVGLLEKFATCDSDSVGTLDVEKAANMTSNPMGAVGGKLGFLELVAPQSANKESRRLGRCFGSTCLFQQELHSVAKESWRQRRLNARF